MEKKELLLTMPFVVPLHFLFTFFVHVNNSVKQLLFDERRLF